MPFFWQWRVFSRLNTVFSWYSDCIHDIMFSYSLKNQLETFLSSSNRNVSWEALREFRELSNLLQATEQIAVLGRSKRVRNWFCDSFLPILFPALAIGWASQTLGILSLMIHRYWMTPWAFEVCFILLLLGNDL